MSDQGWSFVVPYLSLLPEGANLPPWPVVYRQFRRWDATGCFEAVVANVRLLLRECALHRGD